MHTLAMGRVVTRADLRGLGWSDSAVTRGAASGRLAQLRPGVFVGRDTPIDDRLRAIAVARSIADSVLSHRSALLMRGIPVVGSRGPVPTITVPPDGPGSVLGAHLHRAQLRPEDVVEIDGVLVTSVARTLIDVARHRPTGAAVAAIDYALHEGLLTFDELLDVLDFCRVWPRIIRARRAVQLSDSRAESPLESISRLTIGWLGLPQPDLQCVIRGEAGEFLGRGDFYWDEYGVLGEADGRSKYDERPVLTAEKDRQERLEDPGLVVVRWGWWHATQGRYTLRGKLQRGFDRGRARDRAGLPRRWSVSAS